MKGSPETCQALLHQEASSQHFKPDKPQLSAAKQIRRQRVSLNSARITTTPDIHFLAHLTISPVPVVSPQHAANPSVFELADISINETQATAKATAH